MANRRAFVASVLLINVNAVCAQTCTLPTSTTAYNTTECDTSSGGGGAKNETDCTVTCATDYSGDSPTDSCLGAGGEFTLGGCTAACTLPSSTTGFSTTNCDTSSVKKNDAQCTVTCATDYSGTPTNTCSTAGGQFSFGGCTPACTLPSTTPGYITTSCDTSSVKKTEAQCTVECATGYSGTPTDTCSNAGGTFSLGDCMAECYLPSSTTGYDVTDCDTSSVNKTETQCIVTCATGYAGTQTATCSTGGGEFTLGGCMAACTLPSSTTGYDITGCGTSDVKKTAEQCTVTCDTEYSGIATATCSTAGGEFSFGGCTAKTCVLPGSSQGYNTTSCDASSTAKTVIQCTVMCADDYSDSGSSPTVACSTSTGQFSFGGCTPACTLPSSPTGYVATSCGTSSVKNSATECLVSCAADYSGNPTDTCSNAGGAFSFGGCTLSTCFLPDSTTGYDTTSCEASTTAKTVTACTVTCAANYSDSGSSPTDSCSVAGGNFSFAGCTATCILPATTTGYVTTNCDTSSGGGGAKTETECAVTCATGYSGDSVTDSCPGAAGEFSFGGCMAACTLPSTTPGYITTSCDTSSVKKNEAQCTVECATGYSGNPTDTCSNAAGTFSLGGCTVNTCNLPAIRTGYDVTNCDAGNTAKSAAECTVVCADGYSGSDLTVACSAAGQDFDFGGCTPACTLPTSTTGYNATSCDTSSVKQNAAECSVSCATDFSGDATDTCPEAGGVFSFSGCMPKCSLPTSTTGYDATSCGTSSVTQNAEECSVTCASDYLGTAAATCLPATAGGPFSFGGCTPACTLPSSTTGYDATSCGTSSVKNTAVVCSVSCATGYSGIPVDTCPTPGGVFSFGGCTMSVTACMASTTTALTAPCRCASSSTTAECASGKYCYSSTCNNAAMASAATVTGAFTLTVTNPTTRKDDAIFKQGLATGIASMSGNNITASMVTVVLTVARRLDQDGRRLGSGTLNVEYTIYIPQSLVSGSTAQSLADKVKTAIVATSKVVLQASIVQALTGLGHASANDVSVATKAEPTASVAVLTTNAFGHPRTMTAVRAAVLAAAAALGMRNRDA